MLKDKYDQEASSFGDEWNEKNKRFEEESKSMEEALNQKHANELAGFEKEINASPTKAPKLSTTYLQLCMSEEILVKQQKYNEAHVVTQRKQAIEKEQLEKHNKERTEKNKKKLENLEKKHQQEMAAFKSKVGIEYEMMLKHKDQELAKIAYKYKVRKTALENQQTQEKKFNDNDKLLKQKAIADTIRNAKTATKSNFFSVSTAKMPKQSERKPFKTEIDISEDMQTNGTTLTDK